jgi:hypothetical protein
MIVVINRSHLVLVSVGENGKSSLRLSTAGQSATISVTMVDAKKTKNKKGGICTQKSNQHMLPSKTCVAHNTLFAYLKNIY